MAAIEEEENKRERQVFLPTTDTYRGEERHATDAMQQVERERQNSQPHTHTHTASPAAGRPSSCPPPGSGEEAGISPATTNAKMHACHAKGRRMPCLAQYGTERIGGGVMFS